MAMGEEERRAGVVELSDRARDLRYPMLGRVERYWTALRGARLAPARSEVDPRRIEDALEYAFILERIAPGMARFRLAGMHLNDLMGMEVRGMPLTTFFEPEARREVGEALEAVFERPAITRLDLGGEVGFGRTALEGRMLLLPLKSDFGEVTRVLGCLGTHGRIGRTPRRFHVTGAQVEPLAPGLAPVPAGAPAGARPAGSPEPQAPRPPRAEGRPKLYVVRSD
jgi:hypothetical protein